LAHPAHKALVEDHTPGAIAKRAWLVFGYF
jgi:hypothetical protein